MKPPAKVSVGLSLFLWWKRNQRAWQALSVTPLVPPVLIFVTKVLHDGDSGTAQTHLVWPLRSRPPLAGAQKGRRSSAPGLSAVSDSEHATGTPRRVGDPGGATPSTLAL